jgi:hypothetical protein
MMESEVGTRAGGASDGGRRRHFARTAARSVRAVIAAGADAYDRTRHLSRLIPIGPDDVADQSAAMRRATGPTTSTVTSG